MRISDWSSDVCSSDLINDTEKQRCKIRPCLRYQRDPILRPDAEAYQTISAAQRLLAQFGKGIGPRQIAARIMKIQAALAGCGIIQRFAQCFEIGKPARQPIIDRKGGG